MFGRRTVLGALPASLVFAGHAANATVYLTPADLPRLLFPAATRTVDRSLTLTKSQIADIAKRSSTRVHFPKIHAVDAFGADSRLGTIIIDQVYGKHEFITYAVALDTSGAVRDVEIMEYRESYGDQVRLPKWRAQFLNKRHGDPLKIDAPIRNISGATLSCVHITDGVRRVLATYAIAFPNP